MTQVVGTVFNGSTAATTHSLTVPSGVTTAMTGLFVIGTGSSDATTISMSRSGSTFTKLDERNAANTRVAVFTGVTLAAGNTININLSSSQAITVAHYYQDDYTFTAGSLSAAIRSVSSTSTTSGSVTPGSGQRVVLVGVERTTTATTLSSATSSGGETVTQISYGEGTGSAQASAYAGSFVASAAAARTGTINYSNSSANGYAALILTSGGGGGEPPPPGGGQYTTPGQAHNIGKAGGKNHFNLGVGKRSGHVDITENAIEAGYVLNPSGGDAAYYLNADKTAVRMEVPLDGGRTSANTSYPRVEYRELQPGGSGDSDTPKAAWSGASGDHYLTGRSRVVKVPPNKPEVVLAQIHGGDDDTAKIKWRGTGSNASVVATYGDDDYATIATGLSVGTEYEWKIQALNGSIRFYWVNMSSPAVNISDAPLVDSATQYFKAGAYSQSNQTTDSVSNGPCIVELRDLEAWHTGYPPPSTPAGPPTVNAGIDATVTIGSTFARSASEVTNGSTITTRTWKIQSGPTGVGTTIDTDANLGWTPTVAGTYVLRYSATNASGTSSDDVTVTVTSGGGEEPPPTGDTVYELKYPDGTPYPAIGAGTTVQNVSTASALTSALSAATPGTRIVLANGTYSGQFTLTGKTATAASGISVEAATTGGAVFASGSTFTVKDCQHVTVKGLSFPYESVGELFQFRGNAKWVRITRCTFGPASAPAGNTESGNFVFAGDDVSFFRIDHNEFRNKGYRGNAVRVYGNFTKVDAGDGANAGCKYGRIDHNLFRSIKPSVTNDKEPIRYGVSTMSRTVANAVIERNYFTDCLCEPELTSVKMGRIRVSGNTYYRCAGGPVIRHGTDSIMSDNYVIDGNGTSYTEADSDVIGSGGFRFYDSGHEIIYNYCDGLSGPGNFQRALLLDTGDAEGSSTALANHWRVIDATVDRNVIVNCTTAITVGDNYSSAPTGCTVTNNITAAISAGTPPITYVGGIQLAASTVSNNTYAATPAAAGLAQDGDGIWRKAGFGPRMTYLEQADVGPSGDTADTDGTGVPISGGGGPPQGPPVVNAGGSATVLVGQPFTRTATETGSGIITRQWTLESGPGVGGPTEPEAPTAPPAQVFVSTTGNDSNSGTTAGSPKKTLGAALSVAQPGQIIEVASGTYTGNFVTTKGGSSGGGYITIRSAVRHGAIISGNNSGEEAAVVLGHPYIRIQDMSITGTTAGKVRIGVLFKASNLAVVGCKIYNICRFLTGGTSYQGGGGIDFAIASSSNILIDGNRIFDIGAPGSDEQLVHGMYLSSHVTNGRAVNNLIYRVEDFGFHPYDDTEASGWQIVNNTVVDTGRGILQAPNGITRNNIVFNTSGPAYDIRGSGNVGSNNYFGGTGSGATGASVGATSANPQFVNAAADDYRLAAGSPALNSGTTTSAPATDIDGVTRPQGAGIDRGAFETPVGGTGGGGGGGTGGTPTGTVLSTTATLTWTPPEVGVFGLRYAATNSLGTGTNDISVTAATSVPGDPGGGGIEYVAQANASGESGSVSVAPPAGVQAGHAQAAVLLSAGSETITAVPAGWTLWDTAAVTSGTGDPGGPCTAWVYVSTTDTGTAAWTKSGTRKWHVVRLAWSGQSALGAHQVTAETSPGLSHPTPSVAPAGAGGRVIGVVCTDMVNSTAGPFSPPSGWTERYDQTITIGTENLAITVADITASGATTGTFTSTAADEAAVFALVLDAPVAAQSIVGAGIGPRRAATGTGSGSVSGTAPPLPGALTGIGIAARRQIGHGTVAVLPGPQTITGSGILPR